MFYSRRRAVVIGLIFLCSSAWAQGELGAHGGANEQVLHPPQVDDRISDIEAMPDYKDQESAYWARYQSNRNAIKSLAALAKAPLAAKVKGLGTRESWLIGKLPVEIWDSAEDAINRLQGMDLSKANPRLDRALSNFTYYTAKYLGSKNYDMKVEANDAKWNKYGNAIGGQLLADTFTGLHAWKDIVIGGWHVPGEYFYEGRLRSAIGELVRAINAVN